MSERKTQDDIIDTIDQSRNGVSVIKKITRAGLTLVDASCQCFGGKFRTHSNINCENLKPNR